MLNIIKFDIVKQNNTLKSAFYKNVIIFKKILLILVDLKLIISTLITKLGGVLMAVPFRRTSKTSKRMRRTHFKLAVEGIANCPKCGAMIKSHHVCPKCGYYDGKSVVEVKSENKEAK